MEENFTCHINLLRKTLVLVPLICQRKLLNKDYTLFPTEEAPSFHFTYNPRPSQPLIPSMDLSTSAWTPTATHTAALHSMAGVRHHKGLTLPSCPETPGLGFHSSVGTEGFELIIPSLDSQHHHQNSSYLDCPLLPTRWSMTRPCKYSSSLIKVHYFM